MSKFEVGDTVEVIDERNGHGFQLGARVRILEAYDDEYDERIGHASLCYEAESIPSDGEVWLVWGDEIAPVDLLAEPLPLGPVQHGWVPSSDEYGYFDGDLKDVVLERPDPVNHPKHYKAEGGLEAIDVMEAFNLHRDGRLFVASKYILRAGRKGAESEDIRKAIWYLERYADALEANDD